MAVLDRYLGALAGLIPKIAVESLTVSSGDAFEYGRAVGRLEGIKLAQAELDRILNVPEADESESGRNRKA